MTVIEVAKALNISRQRVMAIECVALKKLKHAFLEIDCEQNWIDLLNNIKEKDPNECYYDSKI